MTAEQAALLEKAKASVRAAKVLAEQERLFDFAVSRASISPFPIAETGPHCPSGPLLA